MKVVAIIQARMGSNRLPGKVLCDLSGQPMLAHVVQRVQRAQFVDEVVVATTDEPQDAAILDLCATNGWSTFAGSHLDVLDRYYRAATQYDADVVVRITSDCPLIDPAVVDQVIERYFEHSQVDYVSCTLAPRTYPRGLDTEVFSYEALTEAWQQATDAMYREHVTPYFYCNPEIFDLDGVYSYTNHSQLRWTVDTQEDLEMVQCIFRHFGHDRFDWQEAVAACMAHTEWLDVNAHVQQKKAA